MNNLTVEQELAMLREENAKLKAAQSEPTAIKLSDKGCISVYGLGSRFPVTLYRKQWEVLFTKIDQVKAFIETNREALNSVDYRFAQEKAAKKQIVA